MDHKENIGKLYLKRLNYNVDSTLTEIARTSGITLSGLSKCIC